MTPSVLDSLDPLVAEWFRSRFTTVTEPQARGWPLVQQGRDVLISAPTGSGKTLAAFLISLDGLVRAARLADLPNRVHVVYVSPLRALSNDIRQNLEIPLAEIAALAERQGVPLAPIRSMVRTGDTPQWERQRMGRTPPHILVTTPESLFIILTSAKARDMLRGVHTVIVDEIHAMADDKRGSHLALTLARLDHLADRRPQRIGLSATVKPLEEVARFLSSTAVAVDAGHRREMDLAVEVPRDELGPVASTELWGETYDRLAALIQEHRATLLFVNTRRLSERVTHNLRERLGEEAVVAHHGSLSARLRLDAERRLKAGDIKAVVATASLELGIDVGFIDLVCQIGTPRSIAVALQRVGRSGHWLGAIPKGRFFPTTRDELIECAALVQSIRAGHLDRLEIPRHPLDILAQQIVAAAAGDPWGEDELFAMVRDVYPYRDLPREAFDQVIAMLANGFTTGRGRSGAYLHRDEVNHRVRGRRGARLAAVTSGGAIPDNANYQVVAEPEGVVVGTVDEDFAVESIAGSVFLLGTTSWRVKRVEQGRVRVTDAHGAAPDIPFWLGEAPARTAELSEAVGALRESIASGGDAAMQLLTGECGLNRLGAEQAITYVQAGKAILGTVPTQQTIVAERFFDEAGGMQLVVHAPFGARVNRAWGLALRKRFCRSFDFELQAAATDNGIVLSLTEQHAFPLELVFAFLRTQVVEDVLTQALLASPMFTVRWRWNLARSLGLLRFMGGRKVPPNIQRMRAEDILASVFPDQVACAENLQGEIRIPDHPLVNETIDNCLHEAMDIDGLKDVLRRIELGQIKTVAVDTPEPSFFSHEILNANPYAFLDDAPLEERRTRAVQLRRTLSREDVSELGTLDPKAIEQVVDESAPVVRDADELHDALLSLYAVPPRSEWEGFFATLRADRRVVTFEAGGRTFWTAAERADATRAAYAPGGDATEIVRGWLEVTGPVTTQELGERLALPVDVVEHAVAALEGQGQVLRGSFRRGVELEWCDRRLLARIHRLTIQGLRREIEPVTTADFMRFLLRWHHAASGARLHGVDGVLQVIRQLQGYEIPAAVWESDILPARVHRYEPALLDQLCLSGDVMWGRLSPHPAFGGEEPRRVRPTRVAPLTLFLREDAGWLIGAADALPAPNLTHAARAVLDEIERRGASFFAEIVKATRLLPSQVEDGLWELVAAGLLTADGFENLRSLVDTKRRRGEGRGASARPRHAAGRWALLRPAGAKDDVEKFADQLLRRWGVLCRDIIARETLAPAWRDLLVVLRRKEARGELRGGRFLSSAVGEQFARPEAVDLLRHVRRSAADGVEVRLAASDPLNLTGVLLPGPRATDIITLRDGLPIEGPGVRTLLVS